MIYDSNTAAGHGHFVVAGTVVPQATPFWVTQAQLAQTTYVAGANGVTETVGMIAFDGQAYSNGGVWTGVSVLADSPPQMTLPSGNSVSAAAGQSLPITSLFSATDLDGDSLVYLINASTTTAGHGHFVVAGAVVPQATPYWVTQAQLAQTTFVAGSAGVTDDVRMIAYDSHLTRTAVSGRRCRSLSGLAEHRPRPPSRPLMPTIRSTPWWARMISTCWPEGQHKPPHHHRKPAGGCWNGRWPRVPPP